MVNHLIVREVLDISCTADKHFSIRLRCLGYDQGSYHPYTLIFTAKTWQDGCDVLGKTWMENGQIRLAVNPDTFTVYEVALMDANGLNYINKTFALGISLENLNFAAVGPGVRFVTTSEELHGLPAKINATLSDSGDQVVIRPIEGLGGDSYGVGTATYKLTYVADSMSHLTVAGSADGGAAQTGSLERQRWPVLAGPCGPASRGSHP